MSEDFIEKPIRTIADAFDEVLKHQERDDCSDLWFDVQSTKSFCAEILFLSVRKVRAEVLAACIARVGDLVVSRQDVATQAGRDGKESLRLIFLDERDGIEAAIHALKELQPAASDLEELLREAKFKGRITALHEVNDAFSESKDLPIAYVETAGKILLALLEKARAIEKKP